MLNPWRARRALASGALCTQAPSARNTVFYPYPRLGLLTFAFPPGSLLLRRQISLLLFTTLARTHFMVISSLSLSYLRAGGSLRCLLQQHWHILGTRILPIGLNRIGLFVPLGTRRSLCFSDSPSSGVHSILFPILRKLPSSPEDVTQDFR